MAIQLLRAAGCLRPDRIAGRKRKVCAETRRIVRHGKQNYRTRTSRHHGTDRPIRTRERAEPPYGLSLRLRWPTVEDPGARSTDHGRLLFGRTRWPHWQ